MLWNISGKKKEQELPLAFDDNHRPHDIEKKKYEKVADSILIDLKGASP